MNHVSRLRIGLLVIIALAWLCLSAGIFAQGEEPPQEGNCAITLEGQKFHISGGLGAMDVDPGKMGIPADWIPNLISGASLDPAELGDQNVAILIVDDFGDAAEEGVFDREDLSTMSDFPHGALVKQHTTRMLEMLQGNYPALSGKITIKEVNIGHFDTSKIVDGIRTAIDKAHTEEGTNRFVVNMSFTLLPCDTTEGFLAWQNANPGGSFEDYVAEELQQDTSIAGWQEFMQQQLAQVESDVPMGICLDQENKEVQEYSCNPDPGSINSIVFVAAAGNFGDKFSYRLYPGEWPQVVNVSGLEFDNMTPWLRWFYSNTGEVLAPAAWYRYVNPDGMTTSTIYAGTSFAAPDMSIVAAAHLTTPSPSCPFDVAPPLFAGYAFYDRTFADIQTIFC